MQQKMVKLISGEIIVGDFNEVKTDSIIPQSNWEVKDPLIVVLYQHPQDEHKLIVDLSPINPFASKGDKIVLNEHSIMFWLPENEKTKGVFSQYNQLISGIVTPDVGSLKLK